MTDKQKRDAAVDAFAAAIKSRLDEKAAKGYTGWDGAYPAKELLAEILSGATDLLCKVARPKEIIDIGARAMMLHFRASNAPHQARAIASRPECGCSAIPKEVDRG